MKCLKFSEPLPGMILRREKDITWRINDEKAIMPGDRLSLCSTDGKEFGQADVVWIKETTFGDLTPEDKAGHEKFGSDNEMCAAYSGYYKLKVTSRTSVKVIKFRVV